MDVGDLQQRLRDFAREREWEQFHDPKNLTMALAAEVGELTEVFQWMTTEESRQLLSDTDRLAAEEELADVAIYVVRLADVLGVDLDAAIDHKLDLNAERYPVHLSRGNAIKHERRST